MDCVLFLEFSYLFGLIREDMLGGLIFLQDPIIGAIALGILPNLTEPGKEFENKGRTC